MQVYKFMIVYNCQDDYVQFAVCTQKQGVDSVKFENIYRFNEYLCQLMAP